LGDDVVKGALERGVGNPAAGVESGHLPARRAGWQREIIGRTIVNKRLSVSLAGAALLLSSGLAQAACEGMNVIVRNSVYSIRGLEAFCTEFNKMKADLADMRSELTIAKRENAMLRDRLTGTFVQLRDERLVRNRPVRQKESQMWNN
jgi:hypothetical protein